MHEVSIAQGLLKILEDEAKKHEASRVTRVHVRIGELSTIVPDALTFAFEVVSEGTLADGAELNIEIVPAKGRCDTCDIEFSVDSSTMFLCPQCGGVAAEIVSGKELDVTDIEAE
jgi:hydrogenase nickel incorporation protein HypA/HybF